MDKQSKKSEELEPGCAELFWKRLSECGFADNSFAYNYNFQIICVSHNYSIQISYDLKIAREDNQVDMRYLINMDYSADLSINSMGRRVRSRLYFTSESHLHSLLNVLRFPSSAASPLSQKGQDILASASELCYLTQVVLRLFEDHSKPVTFSRRFRVEIMFSPGKLC
jgi:inositol hexakisphosphate/diphosphoinositol-pentakisphosphate kinase